MSAPMNMDDWQRRMKAEKDAQRQKKTESADLLRSYKGGVRDEDLKLKALRDEERRRFQDAQQNLHGYKASFQESTRKEKPQQQPVHPIPVNAVSGGAKDDPLANIVTGNVSERAAAFSSTGVSAATSNVLESSLPGSEDDVLANIATGSVSESAVAFAATDGTAATGSTLESSPPTFHHADQQSQQVELENFNNEPASNSTTTPDAPSDVLQIPIMVAPGAVDEDMVELAEESETQLIAPKNTLEAQSTENLLPLDTENLKADGTIPGEASLTVASLNSEDPGAGVKLGEKAIDSENKSHTEGTPDATMEATSCEPKEIVEAPKTVEASDISKPVKVPETLPEAHPTPIAPCSGDASDINITYNLQNGHAKAATVPEPVASRAAVDTAESNGDTSPRPLRLEVLFSFGLVTVQSNPDLSSYMDAVQSIVVNVLKGKQSSVRHDVAMPPYVKKIERDDQYVSKSGRKGVRRIVVTAAVPIVIPSLKAKPKAKETIVQALQSCIQSGKFLLMAQEDDARAAV